MIEPKQIYQHHSGRLYEILHLTNKAHPSPKFLPMVVYKDENGEVWSRKIQDFLPEAGKFILVLSNAHLRDPIKIVIENIEVDLPDPIVEER